MTRSNAQRRQSESGCREAPDIVARWQAVHVAPVEKDTGVLIPLVPEIAERAFSVIFEESALLGL